MKLKAKLFILLSLIIFACPAFADEISKDMAKKIAKIERYIYGSPQSGSEDNRLRQVEEDLFGRSTGQKASEKADYLHDLLFKGSIDSPSVDMKLNFLEWRLFNKTGLGNLETRLAELDKQVIGNVSLEPMAFRLEQLVHLTIDNGKIHQQQVTVAQGTRVKLKLIDSLSSRKAKKGDIVQFSLSEDLFIDNNILAMAKGGIISGSVASVRRGGRFGRTGYINLEIGKIESMDSTSLPVEVADAGQERFNRKKLGMAVGASTLGYVVLGPIGIAGGAFIKGKDVEVKAGTEIEVRTLDDRKVMGVLVHRK